MIKLHAGKLVKKSLKHAPDHYRLAAVKRIARRASRSGSINMQGMDAREVAGFVPVMAKVVVVNWPTL